MGYYSNIYGEIHIDPPVDHTILKDMEENLTAWNLFKFWIETEKVDTDEGTLTRRWSDTIVPSSEDSVKAYSTMEDLAIIARYCKPGTKFTGDFVIKGEESGDISRVFIENDDSPQGWKITSWEAKLLWPDGSTSTPR